MTETLNEFLIRLEDNEKVIKRILFFPECNGIVVEEGKE